MNVLISQGCENIFKSTGRKNTDGKNNNLGSDVNLWQLIQKIYGLVFVTSNISALKMDKK